MEMTTGPLCLVTPFNVAFTKSVTFPTVPPAVKSTTDPLLSFRVPRALVSDQENTTSGQVLPEHEGVAVKVSLLPVDRVTAEGLTLTEVRGGITVPCR